MGYSIARAAEHRGGEVVLITGPVNLPDPLNVNMIHVQTAEEMASAVFKHMKRSDIIIKAAAVSDYRPVTSLKRKIKKGKDEMVLALQKNQDILKAIRIQALEQIQTK
jgi:phosphopantothenoylcysteine decarboxylase/phosphopantothenate--cysteine ligase